MSKNILGSVIEIKKLFAEWVDTIDLANVRIDENFSKLIKDNDLFLSMNYTYTLEQVYGISEKMIVHLHGEQKKILFLDMEIQKTIGSIIITIIPVLKIIYLNCMMH